METPQCTSMVMEKCVETSGCTSMEKRMQCPPPPPLPQSFSTSQQTNKIHMLSHLSDRLWYLSDRLRQHSTTTSQQQAVLSCFFHFIVCWCVVMFLPLHCLLVCCHVSSTSLFVGMLSCFFHFTVCVVMFLPLHCLLVCYVCLSLETVAALKICFVLYCLITVTILFITFCVL